MSLRSLLYTAARFLGDWNAASRAIKRGSAKPIVDRIGRRVAGRIAGRIIGGLFR